MKDLWSGPLGHDEGVRYFLGGLAAGPAARVDGEAARAREELHGLSWSVLLVPVMNFLCVEVTNAFAFTSRISAILQHFCSIVTITMAMMNKCYPISRWSAHAAQALNDN